MELENFLDYSERQFLPNLSIDLVIIGYQKNELKCLLLQIGPKWVLPGGHIKKDESVDDAVLRILAERTSLENPYFKFLAVFGNKDRNFKEEFHSFFKEKGLPWSENHWLADRFVTLAYYALVDIENTDAKPGAFDEAAEWFSFEKLPEIGLDHHQIITKAKNRLKKDVQREQLTYNLLPHEFTMPELHRLHEKILAEKLDRSRFQKKMLGSGLFERLPKRKNQTPGSNPYQYRLKK